MTRREHVDQVARVRDAELGARVQHDVYPWRQPHPQIPTRPMTPRAAAAAFSAVATVALARTSTRPPL